MKKTTLYLLALSTLFCLSSFRLPNEAPYTKSQIESFIREVFVDQADAMFFTGNSGRLTLIEGFLSRIEIRNSAEYAGKKFNLLSGVALQNKYNPNLIREAFFNPTTFNPLKYRLPMTSKNREVFRVDGTDYLIIIQPVK
jgi:hypothetical protein